jgi:pantoate--beta-alanine ligase
VLDLSIPTEIVGCPTVREPDGLALSSRNRLLSATERAAAPVLSRALGVGRDAIASGADGAAAESLMAAVVAAEPLARLDYAVVTGPDLEPPGGSDDRPVRLLVAADVGSVRLIDNLEARP